MLDIGAAKYYMDSPRRPSSIGKRAVHTTIVRGAVIVLVPCYANQTRISAHAQLQYRDTMSLHRSRSRLDGSGKSSKCCLEKLDGHPFDTLPPLIRSVCIDSTPLSSIGSRPHAWHPMKVKPISGQGACNDAIPCKFVSRSNRTSKLFRMSSKLS
jgi:hypothetical protein